MRQYWGETWENKEAVLCFDRWRLISQVDDFDVKTRCKSFFCWVSFPQTPSWTDRQTAPHSRYVKAAFKDRLQLVNCIIFAGVCTPSLVHFTRSDSITMGAEMAAAGRVMPSLNSSAILIPGFWFLSATHSLRVWIYGQNTQFCRVQTTDFFSPSTSHQV